MHSTHAHETQENQTSGDIPPYYIALSEILSCPVTPLTQVEDGIVFPADLVLLSSAHAEGVCYIETMNLDGETNLKLKKASFWSSGVEAVCRQSRSARSCGSWAGRILLDA